MQPGTYTHTHTRCLWSYILFAESALAAVCKNRLTGVRIFKQLLYKKPLTVDALSDIIEGPAAENECGRLTHSDVWTGRDSADC